MSVGLTEQDLYDYKGMAAGKYGPQWTAIRKLVDEVRRQKREFLETKPAGIIRNNDLDHVLISSTELHKGLVRLIAKLRPIPIDEAAFPRTTNVEAPPPVVDVPKGKANEPRKLLSVKQAAATVGISSSTFYRLILEGKIRSVKIGGRRLVPVTSIDDFIAAGGDGE